MHPKCERLEPPGAPDDGTSPPRAACGRCVSLEDERDLLQTALVSMTTHLAQIQFRLRQIVAAPSEERKNLLRCLERFASSDINLSSEGITDDALKRRNQQKALLKKLKFHLEQVKNAEFTKGEFKTDKDRYCLCEIINRTFSLAQSTCFAKSSLEADRWRWRDLTAKLELAINDLKKMIRSKEKEEAIVVAVRRNLAGSIRDLLQHGSRPDSVIPFFKHTSSHTHIWDVILYYYRFNKGDEYNSTTSQRLSKSFNLSMLSQNDRRQLLSVIEEIVSTHSRYKRDRDSHFKAFVCAGLNAKRLVDWLSLIFRCDHIVETFYYPWSYVANMRYEDALKRLDVLSRYKFDLPVDLDVRRFQIEDNVFI